MPRRSDRVLALCAPITADLDAALAAPTPDLLRAVERDGARAHDDLLAALLLRRIPEPAPSASLAPRPHLDPPAEPVPSAILAPRPRLDPPAEPVPSASLAPRPRLDPPAEPVPSASLAAALEPEDLGTIYGALAGRRLVRLDGRAARPRGHAPWLPLAALAEVPEAMRPAWLHRAGLPRPAARRLASRLAGARDEAAVLAALGPGAGTRARGDVVLQPCPESHHAGAHYTPRPLAEAVVRAGLRPVLAALGPEPSPADLLRLRICDPAMGCGAFLLAVVRALADLLVAAWSRSGQAADLDLARRLVAERCIFGVDADPSAVTLARRACGLLVGADLPALAAHLRHGDALLGVDLDQLRAFHWRPAPPCGPLADALGRAPGLARPLADLLLDTFLSHRTDRDREHARRARLAAVLADLARGRLPAPVARDPPCFHWPLELPGRFDLVVGNPPFLGGGQISGALGDAYAAWLRALHPGAHGNADLCAHFVRRADDLLADSGTISLIATNTLGQGDTRATGLQPLLARGYTIYAATRDLPWPDAAAVTVSVVHLARGAAAAAASPYMLDEPAADLAAPRRARPVAAISSHLRPDRERDDPRPLASNRDLAFAGSKIYGQGFLLSPDERAALVARDPRNAERISPYLGGEEIVAGTGPTRLVIDFSDLELDDAARYPDLLARVRERVKPERDRNARAGRRDRWWRFGETAPGLYRALAGLDRCVVNSQVAKHLIFDLVPATWVYSHTAYVYASRSAALFAVLQSRVHEAWARRLASSMKTDLRYSIADCFDTFPFPRPDPEASDPALEDLGERLLRARAEHLRAAPRTLTRLYAELRDPHRDDPALARLRELHVALDRAVLAAYGWVDLAAPAYTAPLEVLADAALPRLFALNAQRAR